MDYPGVGTGIMIQNEKGQILMGLRKQWELWSFPGGKLYMFESLVECIKRETFEECGLVIHNLTYLGISNDLNQSTHFLTVQFFSSDWSGEVVNKEPEVFERWEWFHQDDLPNNIFIASLNIINNQKYKKDFNDLK